MGSMGTAPTMKLDVLSYERLAARDESEIQKMVDICSNEGIFFLDLTGPTTKASLANMGPVIDAQRDFFAESPDKKLVYADDSPNRGYDSFDEIGVQRFKLSREHQMQGQLRLPAHLRAVEAEIGNMFTFNDTVLRHLSILLCNSLDIPTTDVKDAQNPGVSNMCLGIANGTAGTALMPSHLDEDYLTITYYDEPFLEVQDRTTQEWKSVEVFQNMPLVNVGDRLEAVSKARLFAPPHRVVQTPKEINLIMYDLNEGTTTA